MNEHKLPTLAKLARAFLAILVTSAALERIWSHASRVQQDPELAQRTMYNRENIRLLYMYYEEMTGKPLEDAYLTPLKDTDTDIGQHDHLCSSETFDLLNEMLGVSVCCMSKLGGLFDRKEHWNRNRLMLLLFYYCFLVNLLFCSRWLTLLTSIDLNFFYITRCVM